MAATLPSADVFSKISDPIEKEKILRDLAQSKTEIIAKSLDAKADLLLLSPFVLENQDLKCRILGTTQHRLPEKGTIIISYILGGEKYFQMVDFIKKENHIVLIDNYPIYYLQRREDYRVRMTPSYKILLETSSVNNIVDKRSVPIQDLSGGGCRIQLDASSPHFKVGATINGHLFLPDRDPIEVQCVVKYSRFDGTSKVNPIYGLQFISLSKITKNRIIALVLDLYRQFFAGRS
jgi:hypothetical protein